MIYIGTSGWQYRHWRRLLYADRPRGKTDLSFYAERFQTVEVNATFYRLPEAETFDAWRGQTPDDFIIGIKASRYLTHILRLRDPRDAIATMMERARRLGGKLGPVLVQLPPDMRIEERRLRDTLAAFPRGVRVAVEPRHESWFVDSIERLLREHNSALCIADRKSRLITPEWRTADWGYLRLHEGLASPRPCYGRTALEARARLAASMWDDGEDMFAYFNNDPRGCAVRDAGVFARLAARMGRSVSRVPAGARVSRD